MSINCDLNCQEIVPGPTKCRHAGNITPVRRMPERAEGHPKNAPSKCSDRVSIRPSRRHISRAHQMDKHPASRPVYRNLGDTYFNLLTTRLCTHKTRPCTMLSLGMQDAQCRVSALSQPWGHTVDHYRRQACVHTRPVYVQRFLFTRLDT